MKRNILILMADEFRHDAAGFGGNRLARTPNLDRLAEGSIVCGNAHSPSPVCVPARQCMAMGKYPLHIGCENFGEDIAPGSPTFARWFAEHGYYTVACGKLHHRGPDQMQGWLQRIGSECAVNWPEAYKDREQIGRMKWRGAEDLRKAGPGLSPLSLHDDLTVEGAMQFLRMHFGGMYPISKEVPLLLLVSLQQPHFPFLADAEPYEYYFRQVPSPAHAELSGHPILDHGMLDGDAVSADDIRRATAAYYAMVEKTDQRFGKILGAIEQCGQDLSQWGVVFASDHGEMLGEHGGLWGKRKFYDASVRVPLFLRWPGLPPSRTSRLCNLVDVFPTLCELSEVPTPEGLDGTSILAGSRDNHTYSQLGKTHFMVRKNQWKYMTFGQEAEEVLFDLGSDPDETRNLAKDPAHSRTLAELRGLLRKLQIPSP